MRTVGDDSTTESAMERNQWKEISTYFAELPMGQYHLVLVDDYSRFPIVEIVSSTSANVVIPCIEKVFS